MSKSDRIRVLVVEDDADNRELIAEILSEDFDVATAPDGQAGWTEFLAHRPSVVLTDQNLPGMTGTSLARQLKGAAPQVGVVLVTGDSHVPEAEICDAVLEKPIDVQQLTDVLREVSGRQAPGS